MKELKVYVPQDGPYGLEPEEGGEPVEEETCYLKSDVDAVIAELKADYKEACDRLQTANLIKDEQLAATRHQKFKRCLAMVRIAQDDWHLHNSFYAMGHREFEKRKC